jgi:DNA-binding XRE family transcriptional regulator
MKSANNTLRDILYCSKCDLVQFEPPTGDCRRCNRKLESLLLNRRKLLTLPSSSKLSTAPLAKRIGATIRSLRKERKLSQARLAASIGAARPCLSRIERGLALPTLKTLERVAAAFDMDILDLFIRIR